MPMIPAEILPILADLGITEAATRRWKRLDPWPGRFRAHYFCPCALSPDGQQRLDLEHAWLGGRRVFIGHCRWCKAVFGVLALESEPVDPRL